LPKYKKVGWACQPNSVRRKIMQIKDLDELEKSFNNVAADLKNIESLSKILLDCLCGSNCKPKDIQNLTDVLTERIKDLSEKFDLITESFII
jgi:hypothetical protein